jgi:hypothetical protein
MWGRGRAEVAPAAQTEIAAASIRLARRERVIEQS